MLCRLLLACLLSVLLHCASFCEDAPPPLHVSSPHPDELLNAKFANTDGWIGADGVYSIPLPDESTLWIFGDTLVGKIRDGKRLDLTMVNNSFARQRGWAQAADVQLLLNHDQNGQATSFVVPKNKPGYFWLWDGIVLDDKLYIFATRLTSPGTITAFDWKLMDQSLIVVDNPLDDPANWKHQQLDLPFGAFGDDYEAIWGIEVLQEQDFVYVYGSVRFQKEGPRSLVVARAAAQDLTEFDRWVFYDQGGWQADSRQASSLTTDVGTEGSITYLPDRDRYIYVYSPPLGPHIMMRTASTLLGPWSEAVNIYTCPEAEWDSRIFCYAGKARLIPGRKNQLLISYATNSFEMLPHVTADARIYVPRFVLATIQD